MKKQAACERDRGLRGIRAIVAALSLAMSSMGALLTTGCSPTYSGVSPVIGAKDTAESNLGERLFREPRFSKYFVQQTGGDPNGVLTSGDPALNQSFTARRGQIQGPFAGQAMSCVACHMVGDGQTVDRGGMRGYADFSQRSPIPHLDADSLTTTPRNSPTLINAFIDRPGPFLLHYDGEFATIEDLVIGSYTGRNFGWLPTERSEALANIVRVIREDNGNNALGAKFSGGISYREMLLGKSSAIPTGAMISEHFRIDITSASDQAILNQVASLVKTYLQALQFKRDPVTNAYTASAYDHFLAANALPQKPNEGETDLQYAGRLAWALQGLANPTFVHDDSGDFGAQELDGLRIFLATSKSPTAQRPGYFQAGNCVACHAPPNFTDFRFHNTGASQEEYDSVHGQGAFFALRIPTLSERSAQPDAFLPASGAHPRASGRFRAVPSAANPGATDLGAWNIFLNPDMPASQPAFAQIFCGGTSCADAEAALASSIATFKTPGLRGLALSDPYLHTGRMATLGDVLRFYQRSSELQRAGLLRNGDPELSAIQIDAKGVASLSAFLDSLNEDYE